MFKENRHGLALFTIILDNNARATNNLAGITLTINLAQTNPLAKLLGIFNLDEVDVVFGAESLDELGVLLFSALLVEDAKMGLTSC